MDPLEESETARRDLALTEHADAHADPIEWVYDCDLCANQLLDEEKETA